MEIEKIVKNSEDVSKLFAVSEGGVSIDAFRLSYTKQLSSDPTAFSVSESAMSALASISTGHTDNKGIFMSSSSISPASLLMRVDIPDAAFTGTYDRVAVSIYDDEDDIKSHRLFELIDFEDENKKGGYHGYIWFNDASGAAGSVKDKNGIDTNPCNTWSDVISLISSTKINAVNVARADSTITLSDNFNNKRITGKPYYELDINTKQMDSSYIEYARIAGTEAGTGNNGSVFNNCVFDNASLYFDHRIFNSFIEGSLTMQNGCQLINCRPHYFSVEAVLDNDNNGGNFSVLGWEGDIKLNQFGGGVSATKMILTGRGKLNLNTAGANLEIWVYGDWKITNPGDATVHDNEDVEGIPNNVSTILSAAHGSGSWESYSGTVIDANLISIDGELTAGNNATLNLKKLDIFNPAGDSVYIGSGSGGYGIRVVGDTTGAGVRIDGGNASEGLVINGNGFAPAVQITGGASGGDGIDIASQGAGNGIDVHGGTAGIGVRIQGGTTDGNGINVSTTDGIGLNIFGAGGKDAVNINGGAAENSNGITITSGSADGYGIRVLSYGTKDALNLTAVGSGQDIKAKEIDDIKSVTDQNTAGVIDVNIVRIDGVTAGVTGLQKSSDTIENSTAKSGVLTVNDMTTNLTELDDDHYNGLVVKFVTGNLRRQGAIISDYDGTTKKISFEDSLTEAPADGDEFVIL